MENTDKLKNVLNLIVNDLEKSAIAIEVLSSGATDQKTAAEFVALKNMGFYDSLRKQIDALP